PRGHRAQRAEDDQAGILATFGADEAAVQTDCGRLDDRPEDVLHGGAGQSNLNPILPPVPRGTRSDDPHRLRTAGPEEARDRVLPRAWRDPDAQVDRRQHDPPRDLNREVPRFLVRRQDASRDARLEGDGGRPRRPPPAPPPVSMPPRPPVIR